MHNAFTQSADEITANIQTNFANQPNYTKNRYKDLIAKSQQARQDEKNAGTPADKYIKLRAEQDALRDARNAYLTGTDTLKPYLDAASKIAYSDADRDMDELAREIKSVAPAAAKTLLTSMPEVLDETRLRHAVEAYAIAYPYFSLQDERFNARNNQQYTQYADRLPDGENLTARFWNGPAANTNFGDIPSVLKQMNIPDHVEPDAYDNRPQMRTQPLASLPTPNRL